jgi:phosphonopyruvate decarboxylase
MPIAADDFLSPARARGFDFYSGVPCSFLTSMINRVISDRSLDYVGAASEGEAVAIAAGAWLAGRRTVVMCQNSGLGNTVNPLTSLNFPFRIPTLMIVTWRGQPGLHDEPQHELMGQITAGILDTMRIPHRPFPTAKDDIAGALDAAEAEMKKSSLPFAYIMAKDSVAAEKLNEPRLPPRPKGIREDFVTGGTPPARSDVLKHLLALVSQDAAVIATTGYCGRELFTLDDRKQHLYQVGSMGCASGMGLGVALNAKRKVIVLDGDGAALMKMGTLATIGARAPENLIHIVLDNGVHESTGGQATVSPSVDFAGVALACGYATGARVDSIDGFETAFKKALGTKGPHIVHARLTPKVMDNLGRPTVKPPEVAQRFKDFLAS